MYYSSTLMMEAVSFSESLGVAMEISIRFVIADMET
jgi:hypothetical protein